MVCVVKRDAFDTWSLAELDAVESTLDAFVPVDAPAGLGDAMRYAVLDGGKRLRPLLVLAGANAVGGVRAAALRAACAVELIHAYSLVHDDLPCMDDDVLRRGKPTVHVRYGVAQAMLAGDAMRGCGVRRKYASARSLKSGLLATAENGGACVVPCRWSADTMWQVAHQRLASASPLKASAPHASVLVANARIKRDKKSPRMPGMNGLDLVSELRTRHVNTPVILITSHPSQSLRDRAEAAHIPIVEKPLLNSLLDYVRHTVSHARN